MPRKRKSANGTEGQGVRSSRRSAGGAADDLTAVAVDPSMMNVWGDFMADESTTNTTTAAAASTNDQAASASKPAATATTPSSTFSSPSGPRSYALPIQPPKATPGLLAQTGTLDASVPGRSSISKTPATHEFECPTLLFPQSVFGSITTTAKIAHIATSPTSCHSVAITTDGMAFGWGRNETGQLGLGYTSAVVPLPTQLSIPGEEGEITFVAAGVGKYHTILVGSNGIAYASGGNVCGQLGINNGGVKQIEKFRKCAVMGQVVGDSGGGEDEDDVNVKIVQVSCGEEVSALLCSSGHLYTTGSSEHGLLGNGETGEYIITAGRLGYANCAKFTRRSIFVQSEADATAAAGGTTAVGGGVDSSGKVKCVPLEDGGQISLASISCGKNHFVAVEAATTSGTDVPRVFTWGSGDYGCLGHGIQADEYYPRLVGALRGPMFASNHPVDAVAGSNCSLVRTKNGHVYYVGKHRQVGEATMRFTLIDALANNSHNVVAIGAGSATVFCSTKAGVTVSWGMGSHGELGYGTGENKSSAKPKFVNVLDSCLVSAVACGMGHTLFLISNEDAEDAKALKKVPKVEKDDIAQFVEQIKGKKSDAGADEPAKKKQKSKKK
eukprot:CAMPEP_0113388110 /NCGR_PEP_ID=MMETSP0013_2-20120614/8907_1 /TAXON_ID=2843 ORGANISM="Skeletonema costatum, Strain 1716" /NCGR_SAMPLE_ID=MMETSP0013_2 /ASSEMBLY_ACC=CAM_ASM_000158 /LENGTH=610 /DNA_ID=CAMNT_0000271075 /DNA_START=210 /DNA_END=2042 /DNA_ORIENTATION=+ /assembly_acc=CAM_ASM_000158